MPLLTEGYAMLGDTQTAALVNNEGSIDWATLRWQIAPYGHLPATGRRYRGDTLVLETDFDTAEGSVRLVDFMPPRRTAPAVVRLVEGIRGRVRMSMDLRVRAHAAIATLDDVWLRTPVETRDDGLAVQADFFVAAGELVPFVLSRHHSHEAAPAPVDPWRALADTDSYWSERILESSTAENGDELTPRRARISRGSRPSSSPRCR